MRKILAHVLALVALCFASAAFALVYPPTNPVLGGEYWTDFPNPDLGAVFGSGSAACSAYPAGYFGANYVLSSSRYESLQDNAAGSNGACYITLSRVGCPNPSICINGPQAEQFRFNTAAQRKTSNWHCEDESGRYLMAPDHGICHLDPDYVDPPTAACKAVQTMAGTGFVKAGTQLSTHTCYNGFDVRGDFAAVVDGNNMIQGPFSCDGSTCTAGSGVGSSAPSAVPPASTATPSTCSGFWGSVNGVDKCIPRVPSTTAPTVTGGSTSSTTGSGTTENGTTSSKETVCANGQCTTTTTTTRQVVNGVTGSPSTSTESKPKTSYCSENPLDPQCKDMTDPCKVNPDIVGCATLGSSESPPFGNVDSGWGGISVIDFGTTATCPPDINFNAMGRPLHFSYAGTCDALGTYVAPILIVLAAFAAAMLFVGGFKV